MRQLSLLLMGLSVSSGIGAWVLLTLNMVVYAILTFWVGSALAFIGFGLIMWALRPKKSARSQETEVGAKRAGGTTAKVA